VQGQANEKDSTISKVDSVLNQAIKDAITVDIQTGIIGEKEIQLSTKDKLLSNLRSKYFDCVRSKDSQDLRINILQNNVISKSNTIKILIYIDVGIVVLGSIYFYNKYLKGT
jgi:hypothetical protein